MKTPLYSLAFLIVRVAFGFRLIYGVIDNVLSWERMLEFRDFLAANGFPLPIFCAVLSVYFQFLAGISWIAGFKIKISAALMFFNFLVAIFAVHIPAGDPYLNIAPALHLLVVSLLLFSCGAGRFSLDGRGGMG